MSEAIQVMCGHVLEVLAGMEPEIVDCVVTSPPYWGLRKYQGEQDVIWGGNKNCQHEWGTSRKVHMGGQERDSQNSQRKGRDFSAQNEVRDRLVGPSCSLCGAWRGGFGLEPTPEMYIAHSVEILRAIRRVLKGTGVVWWNIGDSYSGGDRKTDKPQTLAGEDARGLPVEYRPSRDMGNHPVIKPLDLCLIPEKLAVALQQDGWWVRSIVVWAKDNPMPESMAGWRWERHRIRVKLNKGETGDTKADRPLESPNHPYRGDGWEVQAIEGRPDSEYTDCPGCPRCSPNDGLILRKGSWRPTGSYEHILMLAKSESYFADGEAVKEPVAVSTIGRGPVDFGGAKGRAYKPIKDDPNYRAGSEQWGRTFDYRESCATGRNLRNVWRFPTAQFKGAHFAVFPSRLPELCIKASTSERGNCSKCGRPWARIVERTIGISKDCPKTQLAAIARGAEKATGTVGQSGSGRTNGYTQTLAWRPTCSCNAPAEPALVLDAFCGTGTTLEVAKSLGRRAIGIDISPLYCTLTVKRLLGIKDPKPAKPEESEVDPP